MTGFELSALLMKSECFGSSFLGGIIGNLVASVAYDLLKMPGPSLAEWLRQQMQSASDGFANHDLLRAAHHAQLISATAVTELALLDRDVEPSPWKCLRRARLRALWKRAVDLDTRVLVTLRHDLLARASKVEKRTSPVGDDALTLYASDLEKLANLAAEIFPNSPTPRGAVLDLRALENRASDDMTSALARALRHPFPEKLFVSHPAMPPELATHLRRDWFRLFSAAFRENLKDRHRFPEARNAFIIDQLLAIRGETQSGLDRILDGVSSLRHDLEHKLPEAVADAVVKRIAPPTGPKPQPGGLPANNLTQANISRNDAYVPRTAQMEALEWALASGAGAALTQALAGDGGFGKTEIARAYLYAHASEYDGVWWVDASRAGHDTSIDRLATALGFPNVNDTPREQLRLGILEKLDTGRHLLVLDNVDEPGVLALWPLQPPSQRLITTRLHTPQLGGLTPIEVSAMTPGEARAVLLRHRPDLAPDEHRAGLEAIASEVGHHALALALCAGYLGEHPTESPGTFLAQLQKEASAISQAVLQEMNPSGSLGGPYVHGVVASLSLHFRELQEPWSLPLLHAAAFLHATDLPLDLLVAVSEDLPLLPVGVEPASDDEETQRARVRAAVDELARRSIATVDEDIDFHRLTQRIVRAQLSPADRETLVRHLLAVLHRLLAKALDPAKLTEHKPFILHAQTLLLHAKQIAPGEAAGELALDVGNDAYHRADLVTALEQFTNAESFFRQELGDEHPKVATANNNRGEMLREKGYLEEALGCNVEAERILRRALGEDHPEVATVVNNRGLLFHSKTDLEGALACFVEAERIDRRAFGDDHPNVARDVNNRGGVLREKGDLEGALACYAEAERIVRRSFADDHPNVAILMNNRGRLLQAKGDSEGALACYAEAERIDRRAFGDDHPDVAIDVNNRGSVLQDQGDLEGARRCNEEAFSIFLLRLGPRAGFTVVAAGNLARLNVDPIGLATRIAGAEVAGELLAALREKYGQKP